MIFRGPGFLAVVRFGSSTALSPLSRQQVVSLSQSSCASPVELILMVKRWRGEDVGEELTLRTARKPGHL